MSTPNEAMREHFEADSSPRRQDNPLTGGTAPQTPCCAPAPFAPIPPAMNNTAPEKAILLTPKQVENWRKVLSATIGPYALIMPAEDIQRARDKILKKLKSKHE